MALKRLTNHEMFALVAEWLGTLRAIFAGVGSIAHLLPNLEAIYETFLERGTTPDEALRTLRRNASALDIRHDAVLRGGYEVTGALAAYANLREPGSGAALLSLRDQLWPDGLAHNTRSYFEEGSHATATGAWLARSPEARAIAEAVTLPDGKTLLELVETWIAVGEELLAVERESQDRAAAKGVESGTRFVNARNQFIRVVDAMRANLALDTVVSPETRAKLLTRVDRVEQNADRKRKDKAPDPAANPREPEPDMEEEPEVLVTPQA